MIIWLGLGRYRGYIPDRWALKRPERVGLSESFRIPVDKKLVDAEVERDENVQRIRHIADCQGWDRIDGSDSPIEIRSEMTIGEVLDFYFPRP